MMAELSGLTQSLAARLARAGLRRGILHVDSTSGQVRTHLESLSMCCSSARTPSAPVWSLGPPLLMESRDRYATRRTALDAQVAEARTFLAASMRQSCRRRAVDSARHGGGTCSSCSVACASPRDNGSLKGEVAHDPLVTHIRADGLSFRPRRPVDWLVCDIADQPSKIATVVARWMADGFARCAIFNLKLPMKKRYAEIDRCRQIIDEALRQTPVAYEISLRQLYHDRQEVTGFVERLESRV
jgi:23S rRNA C2498 (ribose-2'-O)-methylase RlmM